MLFTYGMLYGTIVGIFTMLIAQKYHEDYGQPSFRLALLMALGIMLWPISLITIGLLYLIFRKQMEEL